METWIYFFLDGIDTKHTTVMTPSRKLAPQICAMYLGAECIIHWVNPKWHGYINHHNKQVRVRPSILALIEDKINGEPLAEIKLILRPLSSMTEEERNELIALKAPNRFQFEWSHPTNEVYSFHFWIEPERFQWLLSKSFDLFHLIPDGLALELDKTKQI